MVGIYFYVPVAGDSSWYFDKVDGRLHGHFHRVCCVKYQAKCSEELAELASYNVAGDGI